MTDLAQRRALLRSALESPDSEDYSGIAAALQGANEDERASLSKTLPPTRLMKAEGYTPRAVFAVAALGKPLLAAETLVPQTERQRRERAAVHDRMIPVVHEATRDRADEWVAAFIPEFSARSWWIPTLVWEVCRDLVHRRGIGHESVSYLSLFLRQVTGNVRDTDAEQQAQRITQQLRENPELIEKEFWALFRVEGMGSSSMLTGYGSDGWMRALTVLGEGNPGFRGRVLDESLAALLRDFNPRTLSWYLSLHRGLEPSVAEIAQRQSSYLTLLSSEPSTVVSLAQDMLKRGLHSIDGRAVIDASAAVLSRTEKKLLKAQLGILKDLAVAGDEAQRDAIGVLLTEFIALLPPELAVQAKKLFPIDEPVSDVDSSMTGDVAVVPEPRRTSLAADAQTVVFDDATAVREAIAAQIEGAGSGVELPGILAYLHAHPEAVIDEALLDRASAVFSSSWDMNSVSPRCQLTALLASRAGRSKPRVNHRGFRRYVYLREGESVPPEWEVETRQSTSMSLDEDGDWVERETHRFQSGYRFIRTHGPSALLAEQFSTAPRTTPPAPVERVWERALAVPGEGTYGHNSVTDPAPKPVWIVPGAAAVTKDASLTARALDVADVAEEFTFRVEEAREQDGYEQIAGWAAWLLQDNPDTLAAHFHPTFWIATQVVNVRGITPLLTALGESTRVPGGPTYSALALMLSAKEAAHRAQAAEAVAQLCASGVCDPQPFAREIAAHLADGFILAGRLATSLADAATISAISGYRVLQVLAALLPAVTDESGKPITQAGKLVEVAARLSEEYGTPVSVPETLLARRKGSSAMAVAIRALEDVRPRATALAAEAAEQAAGSLAAEGLRITPENLTETPEKGCFRA